MAHGIITDPSELDEPAYASFRAKTPSELELIFKLRYREYLSAGLIRENSRGVLTDGYDLKPSSYNFGIRDGQSAISAIRLTLLKQQFRSAATYASFSDVLSPILDKGLTIVDGSRFVVATTTVHFDLHLQTLRLAILAAEHFGADYGVASIRECHLPFYKRFGNFQVAAEARPYDSMLVPLMLVIVDYKKERENLISKLPSLPPSRAEMNELFPAGS